MGEVEDDLDDLENCANPKVDLEALERLMEPEDEEVFSKVHPEVSRREEAAIFSCSLTQQRKRTISCPEETLKTPLPQQSSLSSRKEEGQWVLVGDRRRRRVAFEETARGFPRYLEDSEYLKASLNCNSLENGQKIFFQILRQGKEDVCIASWARWNAQLNGLVELDKKKVLKFEARSEIVE